MMDDQKGSHPGRAALRSLLPVLWIAALIVFGVVFWFQEHRELSQIGPLIASANPWWLTAALAGVPLVLAANVMVYRNLLQRLGANPARRVVWRAYMRSIVVGTVMPLGIPSSMAGMTRELVRQGVTLDSALLASMLSGTLSYTAFMLLLPPTLVLLGVEHHVAPLIIPAILLTGLFMLLIVLLGIGFYGGPIPQWLERRLPDVVIRFVERARGHQMRAKELLWPGALALFGDLVGALTLWFALHSVGEHPTLSEALIGAELGTLISVAAPIFQGAGVVELTMTVVLEQFGNPVAAALSATLLYRICTLWLPFIGGVISWINPRSARLRRDERGADRPRR